LFGRVAFHVVLTEGQLRLDRLENRVADQQARYERNRLRVAELESPERVTRVAQERLGMVPPPGVTYLSPSGPAADAAPRRASSGTGAGEVAADQPGEAWPSVKARLTARR
jgi:hypothetical protein